MNIACAWRSVKYKVVKLAPVSISYQLLQCACSHTATPQSSRCGRYKETYAQQLYAILLNRHYQVSAILLHSVWTLVLNVKHLWHRRTEDISIQQSHLISQSCQCYGKIGRYSALTNTTLTAAHSNDVLHPWQHLANLRAWSTLKLSLYLNLYGCWVLGVGC